MSEHARVVFVFFASAAVSGAHALSLDIHKQDLNPKASSSLEASDFQACGLDPRDKIVTWIRHGEGIHNVDRLAAMTVKDAVLSTRGGSQVEQLGVDPRLHGNFTPELVVSSPLRRTMATALGAFRNLGQSVPWHLEPDIEETPACLASDGVCNLGDLAGGTALLKQEGRTDLVEQYTALPAGWNDRSSHWVAEVSNCQERFRHFTSWLLNRPEQRVAVVSHGDFLFVNTGIFLDNAKPFMFVVTPGGEWRPAPEACVQQGIVPRSDPPLMVSDHCLNVASIR